MAPKFFRKRSQRSESNASAADDEDTAPDPVASESEAPEPIASEPTPFEGEPLSDTRSGSSKSIRRTSSLSQLSHKKFGSVEEYVEKLGGSKKWCIRKVLIANNGVAAVKAIRSIRRWSYEMFGNSRLVSFVVMATPEDLRANAEYIRAADTIIDVPGGPNNNNYANVSLVVELARMHRCDAVWAGWGHASENPTLPDALANSTPPIKFIGPDGAPMRALGDKIGSTIIAQSAGVPCIGWNGSGIQSQYDRRTGALPAADYARGNVTTIAGATEASAKIGFPVMIKASEGGGGKGIRRVDRVEDVADAYRQVAGEVPGSPIFIMRLSQKSRHLEVQLIADEYGTAIALDGRDCSVQRRHQKIVEEGPPVAADPTVWKEMEGAAVQLAKAVGYANAGTVEYLYSEPDKKFFFLELNPRLQVEHPVTEMITKVNLPATQLQVAMGLPLHNIPEIRELYGRSRFEDEDGSGSAPASAPINFATDQRKAPQGHCIAVRITAENAEAGFKPTSGGIQELNFRSTPDVWGYFSMDSSGVVHEFADSQFGHLFASGTDREHARKSMALALREISIRGDISTNVDYISHLMEMEDFVDNNIDTAWLDGLIKADAERAAASGADAAASEGVERKPRTTPHMVTVVGAAIAGYDKCMDGEANFVAALQKGQFPVRNLLDMTHDVELILEGIKYKLTARRVGSQDFIVAVAGSNNPGIRTNVRVLNDGGYLIALGDVVQVAYVMSRDPTTGVRISIDGSSVLFAPDYDPTSLRADVAGKLVRRCVPDGAVVAKGQPYAEIEVMKMFMPLRVEEGGTISWVENEGAALEPGQLLATLELDDPGSVRPAEVFVGALDVGSNKKGAAESILPRAHVVLRRSLDVLRCSMAGYATQDAAAKQALDELFAVAADPTLPVYEIDEQLSVLSGRIDAELYEAVEGVLKKFKRDVESEPSLRFPAEKILKLLDDHAAAVPPSTRAAFAVLTGGVRATTAPYSSNDEGAAPGCEVVLRAFLEMLRDWIAVERNFAGGLSYADAVDALRRAHGDDLDKALDICRAHANLASTAALVVKIIAVIGDPASLLAGANSMPEIEPCMKEIGDLEGGGTYANTALRARRLLLQDGRADAGQRRRRLCEVASSLPDAIHDLDRFLEENIPITDILLPEVRATNDSDMRSSLLEIYLRSIYRTMTLKDLTGADGGTLMKWNYTSSRNESCFSVSTSMTSMTDLTKALSRSSSMNKLAYSDNEAAPTDVVHKRSFGNVIGMRAGVLQIFETLEQLEGGSPNDTLGVSFNMFPGYDKRTPQAKEPINVLHILILQGIKTSGEVDSNAVSRRCKEVVMKIRGAVNRAGIRRISFLINNGGGYGDYMEELRMPAIFTFRASGGFKEDVLFRHIEPSNAFHLELTRFSKNFHIRLVDVRQTSTSNVHLYSATPKKEALLKDKRASGEPRIFVRALSIVMEYTVSAFERIFVNALNALDVVESRGTKGANNHFFVSLVSDRNLLLEPTHLEEVVYTIVKRHENRTTQLGLAEVEVRIVCCLATDSPPIAIRMVVSNPTGFAHVMSTYIEAQDNGVLIYQLVGGTKASLAGSGDNSWEGMPVLSPYPLTRPFEAQRKAAAASSDTLYCYDLPALFEAACELRWCDSAKNGGEGGAGVARPLCVMSSSELVVRRKFGEQGSWTMKDYQDGNLEISQEQRSPGSNDVGMVAWLITLKTFEYPAGRQMVLIANDITLKAGSFGTREDVVFKLASDLARERRIPRLYVAANSGARIGVADGVRKRFKVAFKDPEKPENGFDYLYVDEDDFSALSQRGAIMAKPTTDTNGDKVYKLTDIIGTEPDLGVENLKGSGLIAGETSKAYNEIFTMTIVLGRTVGIGAYLVRLGQRTIQNKTSSPIILTGYQALNKLMGCDVYTTNDQLGGPGIMFGNGVSHLVSTNHLEAVCQALNWLSYVPSSRGSILPITDVRAVDVVERPIGFCPKPGTPYDPRMLLAGGEGEDGTWLSGFFDRGSFTETLAGWAKSVVVGRARLGGIPMGIIATENRTAEAIKPADPADIKASETVIQQAGCVWFPNSAHKTAQAINDFNTEDLPLMIFANWRGFSGGQRDMFDEVLKFGSKIVDAFVAYQHPVFVYIPPFAEIRGGAWVVLDASINSAVMEMYASSDSSRGGVLEANGLASVKYRVKDLKLTMHRVDKRLKELDSILANITDDEAQERELRDLIEQRERSLLPVYEQISVQFCDLHDTPVRMKATGVIEEAVPWEGARSFFFWRLRRKLAEFDLRKKMMVAYNVGRGDADMDAAAASLMIKKWFVGTPGCDATAWSDDKTVLNWMATRHHELEGRVEDLQRNRIEKEVSSVLLQGGQAGIAGIVGGVAEALKNLKTEDRAKLKSAMKQVLSIDE